LLSKDEVRRIAVKAAGAVAKPEGVELTRG
jgi:hypothetical protein